MAAAANRVERRRSIVYPALIGLGIGMLVSCAQKPPPAPPQTAAVEPLPPPSAAPLRRRVFPLPSRKPAPPPETDTAAPGTASGAGSEAPALAAPSPAPAPTAGELIGLDESGARRLFGAATEKTEAPPATVWRYRNATCELDLFFYLDLRSGKMRTLHYAFKGGSDDPAGRQDCLRSFVVARGG